MTAKRGIGGIAKASGAKRGVALLIAAAMALAIAACGAGTGGTGSAEATESQAAQGGDATTQAQAQDPATTAAQSSGSDSGSEPGGAAAAAEQTDEDRWFGPYEAPMPVKFAVPVNEAQIFPDGDSYSENVWTRGWQDELNIDAQVIWEAVDADSSYETKLNLSIASGELPDIVRLKNYGQFEKMRSAGLLADLTDVFEAYACPRLKENMNADGGIALSWGNVDGRLMGVPAETVNLTSERMIFLRHDWFEATGMAEPKTIEEFVEIAKAMQDADPANRFALPLFQKVIGDNMCDIVGIANAYGAYPQIWVEDGAGGLKYGTVQNEMIPALELYASLYADGRIDPAFTSLDGGKVGEQLTAGKIGALISASWLPSWPLNALWETENVDWDILPVPPSASNPQLKMQSATPNGSLLVVPKGYGHPEALFKILNFSIKKLDDPETADTDHYHTDPDPNFGAAAGYHMQTPLYVHWGDPLTNFNTQKNITKAIDTGDESFLATAHDKAQFPGVKDFHDKQAAGEIPAPGEWVNWKTWYGDKSAYGVLNEYINTDSYIVSKLVGYQTETMADVWSTLIDLEIQYVTEIISGQRPVADFAEFVSAWNAMGGEKITQEVCDWYRSVT
ncbi:MAG: extracellular solute-binding protein [Clostridiales bacterium]|jgi:putative aldouronate transport system substrate-binding protein|nr:extracellular solute-binding protein [Clostridiales bacterium]